MKILHLVNDDKFINFIADTFNACEDVNNTYIVTVQNATLPLKYIINFPNMIIVDQNLIHSKTVIQELNKFDAIVVHYLDVTKATLLLKAPSHIPIVWSGWGADYYCFVGRGESDLLGMESLALIEFLNNQLYSSNKLLRIKNNVKKYIVQTFSKLIRHPTNVLNDAIRRFDYFSAPIPEDYSLIKPHLGSTFKAEYVQLNYVSVEKTFALGTESISGDNILVGNSAFSTNNHLEMFRLLSRLDLNDRKIVVPLSYGVPAYRDAIIKHGLHLFGDLFVPLTDFMPLDKYNDIISKCSIVVMGHLRQQALGNTATMLFKGAKVYMDENSTAYQFFKKRGLTIYNLLDLKDNTTNIFEPLKNIQRQKNRELLEMFWGHELVLNNTRNLINILNGHIGHTSA